MEKNIIILREKYKEPNRQFEFNLYNDYNYIINIHSINLFCGDFLFSEISGFTHPLSVFPGQEIKCEMGSLNDISAFFVRDGIIFYRDSDSREENLDKMIDSDPYLIIEFYANKKEEQFKYSNTFFKNCTKKALEDIKKQLFSTYDIKEE